MPVEIEIMKTEACPWCPLATEIVKKVAKQFGNKVVVKETYVDKDKEAMKRAKDLGIMAVPVILINGMLRFTGVPREINLKYEIEEEIRRL